MWRVADVSISNYMYGICVNVCTYTLSPLGRISFLCFRKGDIRTLHVYTVIIIHSLSFLCVYCLVCSIQ